MRRLVLQLGLFVEMCACVTALVSCVSEDKGDGGSGNPDAMVMPGTDGGSGTDGGGMADAGGDAMMVTDTGVSPDLGCKNADGGCINCCFNKHPDGGYLVVSTQINCACTNPGLCKTECNSNLCSLMTPTQACLTCLGDPNKGNCNSVVQQACNQSPDCLALAACTDNVCK